MKPLFTLLALVSLKLTLAQQYDGLVIERDSIDSNNHIYKTGNAFVFDYEIIENGKTYKLRKNGLKSSKEDQDYFELSEAFDSLETEFVYLLVKPRADSLRTNTGQTQVAYIQGPSFTFYSETGIVENPSNVWIHPVREGFFRSLETVPFPFIQFPLEIGHTWTDAMVIGSHWCHEKWGVWEGGLLLDYTYKIAGKEKLNTVLGELDCYVVESTAFSSLGETTLKAYFSEDYGFVRMEYVLLTGIQVNLWLVDYKTNKTFTETLVLFNTKKYYVED